MSEQKIQKKKKSHFFETYILKVLKQICTDSGITANSKHQLNSALCIIAKNMSSIVIQITTLSKKKTISDKEVGNALRVLITGELLNNAIKEGEKAVQNFKCFKEIECEDIDDTRSLLCRQSKAEIIFPPSLAEKFLRNFGYSKVMVSSLAPVYLAAVLEYLTFEILDLSNSYCRDNKRVRINIRDMELSVRNDSEIDRLFTRLNISFLGGGVIPFIHSSLMNKTTKKPTLKHSDNNTKKRRFHSGTVALRNIKKQQKFSDTLVFAKLSFEKFVRQIFKENCPDDKIKISKDVFIVLQYFIEQYIVNVLQKANLLVIHAGRVKLLPVDIGLISYFNNKCKNPYIENTEDTGEILTVPTVETEIQISM